MSSKQERYFSGIPTQDPSKPLPGEVSPARRRAFWMLMSSGGALVVGLVLGLWMAPQAPGELIDEVAALEAELARARDQAQALERTLAYRESEKPVAAGKLDPAVRERHEVQGERYARLLRQLKAQGAGELMAWFVRRWNELLDQPQPEDRTGRRAATLSLLVGGMAENIAPEDFVPWQASFFNEKWLGELHFDVDGDGLPAPRRSKNPKDGFANVSVCHIAMALNQATTDAQILVTPDMRCDRPESRMSIFLQGSTLNDAIDEFVEAIEREGFLVVERYEKGVRLVLVGAGRAANRRARRR